MSDLARTMAAAFRRKGASELAVAEVRHVLSLDLRWFAPADAKRVLQRAVEVGLVEERGEAVRATFDPARIDVPLHFRPTLAVLDETAAPAAAPGPAAEAAPAAAATAPLPGVSALSTAAALTGEGMGDLVREADEDRARWGPLLAADVAALLVARRRGVDVRAEAERLLAAR